MKHLSFKFLRLTVHPYKNRRLNKVWRTVLLGRYPPKS